MYYFAYGSNLDTNQMEERCPQAEPVGKALLPDYSLAFGGHSPNWDGAPATVVGKEDVDVPGLLYEISYEEIRILDEYEGHPDRYERRSREILLQNGDSRQAQVYVKDVNDDFVVPPISYLSVIHEAYHELGFDPEILKQALALGTHDSATDAATLLSETTAAQPV